jgi:hypothetical protein
MTTFLDAASRMTDCMCSEGSYHGLPPASSTNTGAALRLEGACEACPEGMTCLFGSQLANIARVRAGELPVVPEEDDFEGRYPTVNLGYYSTNDDPLFIYMCKPGPEEEGDTWCPGGLPESCNGGRETTELNCALCPDGDVQSAFECKECSGFQNVIFLVCLVLFFPFSFAGYKIANGRMELQTPVGQGLGLACGLIWTTVQIFAVLGYSQMTHAPAAKDVYSASAVSTVDADSFSYECVFGRSPETGYMMRFITPYLVCFPPFFLGFIISKIVCKNKPWTGEKTFNAIMAVIQAFFIVIADIASLPFDCYSHPNGEKSVSSYPGVLCNMEDEHMSLVVMSLILMLTFLLPFLVLCLWAVLKPMGKNKPFRFLFFRWRPSVHWWGLVIFVRQAFLAFARMVNPNDPVAQLIYIEMVIILYLVIVSAYQPWREIELNLYEVFTLAIIGFLVVNATSFTPKTSFQAGHKLFSWFMLLALFTISVISLLLALKFLLQRGIKGRYGIQLPLRQSMEDLGARFKTMCSRLSSCEKELLTELMKEISSYDRLAISRIIVMLAAVSDGQLADTTGMPFFLLKIQSERVVEKASQSFASLEAQKEAKEISV